jgi:hypothetical protein
LFYDVTTLYFEADYGDDFRETGFSKDGKHSQPQVVLGFLENNLGWRIVEVRRNKHCEVNSPMTLAYPSIFAH